MVIGFCILLTLGSRAADMVGIVLFAVVSVWAAIFLVLGFKFEHFKCPRFGGKFFSDMDTPRDCSQCGLKL